MENFHYTGNDVLEVMLNAQNYNAFLEKLIIHYIPKEGLILDIGAGIGTFAKGLKSKGYAVHCIEPDPDQCEQIKEAGLEADISIESIADYSIDFIYSLNVLEHIENDLEAIKNWKSKLKPGGRFLFYLPAFNILFSSSDRSVGHYRRYDKRMLINRLTEAGLEIEKVCYADSLGFFVALVYKWLDNGKGELNKKTLIFYDRIIFPASRFCDFFLSRLFGKNVYGAGYRP